MKSFGGTHSRTNQLESLLKVHKVSLLKKCYCVCALLLPTVKTENRLLATSDCISYTPPFLHITYNHTDTVRGGHISVPPKDLNVNSGIMDVGPTCGCIQGARSSCTDQTDYLGF